MMRCCPFLRFSFAVLFFVASIVYLRPLKRAAKARRAAP